MTFINLSNPFRNQLKKNELRSLRGNPGSAMYLERYNCFIQFYLMINTSSSAVLSMIIIVQVNIASSQLTDILSV